MARGAAGSSPQFASETPIMQSEVMERFFAIAGALLGLLSVGLGAFGAHSLRSHFGAHPDLEPIFRTASEYQMFHALALLGVAWAVGRRPGALLHASGYLFVAGTIVFSGSLYALSISTVKGWGAVTPIGGVALMAGWLCLACGLWKAAPSADAGMT